MDTHDYHGQGLNNIIMQPDPPPAARLDPTFGVGAAPRGAVRLALIGAVVLAVLFAGVGYMSPMYEASALLQFPTARLRSPEIRNAALDLPVYRRAVATYISTDQMTRYAQHLGIDNRAPTVEMIRQSRTPGFWDRVAMPMAPLSREDRRQFGLQKAEESAVLLGVRLGVTGRRKDEVSEMIEFLGMYYSNTLIRARIRNWMLESRIDVEGARNLSGSEIVRLGLQNKMHQRRIAAMKEILVRYPDAARLDPRTTINVVSGERNDDDRVREERLLSPLAQIVASESAIAQNNEMIERLEREIYQRELLGQYFVAAERIADSKPDAFDLVSPLRELALSHFVVSNLGAEAAVQEVRLGIEGALDIFEAMPTQYGVRGSIRVHRPMRNEPAFLGVLGAILGGVGFAVAGHWIKLRRAARVAN